MTEYVEWMFNSCPECDKDSTKVRSMLIHRKGSEFSEPCTQCGCKFGKIIVPREKHQEKMNSAPWAGDIDGNNLPRIP